MGSWGKYALIAVMVTGAVFVRFKSPQGNTLSDLRDAMADGTAAGTGAQPGRNAGDLDGLLGVQVGRQAVPAVSPPVTDVAEPSRRYSATRSDKPSGAAALPAVPVPGDESKIFTGFDKALSGWNNVIPDRAAVPGTGVVLTRINPSAELDNYLRTDVVFKTPKGNAWHIAATRVVNCPDGGQNCAAFRRYFILFMSDHGQLIGVSGLQLSNYSLLKKGGKTIFFDGDGQGYTVKLYVAGLSVDGAKKSTLEISLNGRVFFKTSIGTVIDAMNIRGVPVRFGRDYRVFLGRDIRQDQNGEVSWTDQTTLALVPESAQTESETISLTVSDITPEGVIFPADKNFALRRISAGVIELYKL